MISDDKENSSSKDDRGKLKTVKRKVKHLFGKADKEEENQAADFIENDTQGELCIGQTMQDADCGWHEVSCRASSSAFLPLRSWSCRGLQALLVRRAAGVR